MEHFYDPKWEILALQKVPPLDNLNLVLLPCRLVTKEGIHITVLYFHVEVRF